MKMVGWWVGGFVLIMRLIMVTNGEFRKIMRCILL